MSSTYKEWSTLDHAAKIFPPKISKTYSSFFRIEIILVDNIVYHILKESLEITLKRYPHFQVKLRRGAFWYFFEECEYEAEILPLEEYELCHFSNLFGHKQKALWRILIQEKTIAIEISHILTDGIGASEFARTLLCVYYEKRYETNIEHWGTVKKITDEYDENEFEYSYKKYFNKLTGYNKYKIKPVFHYPDFRYAWYKSTRIQVPLNQIKSKATSYEVGITEYITAIHMFAVQRLYKKMMKGNKGVVRDVVLINLRNLFKSKTLRNFYWVIMPSIDFSLGEYAFDEILRKVHFQFQDMMDPREIRRHFSEYVAAELIVFNRVVPRPIKDIVLAIMQNLRGEKINTSSISNLGNFKLPTEVSEKICSCALFPLPSMITGKNIGVMGINNICTIAFGKYIDNSKLEQEIALELKQQGLDVTYLEW